MPHPKPLPTGRGVDNQIVTNYPPRGEGLGVGQKQYYATYVKQINPSKYILLGRAFFTTQEFQDWFAP
jgi:hypothetical protein